MADATERIANQKLLGFFLTALESFYAYKDQWRRFNQTKESVLGLIQWYGIGVVRSSVISKGFNTIWQHKKCTVYFLLCIMHSLK